MPAKKLRRKVLYSPFIPVYFGENRTGMQSGKEFKGFRFWFAKKIWLWSRFGPVFFHYLGEYIGIHKEVINRLIEPWIMTDIILSGTEWSNFISLRANEEAQPEIQVIAQKIKILLRETKPVELQPNQWHLPFIKEDEMSLDIEIKKKISTARCARVSYALFDGKVSNIESDIKLCERLLSSGHWSPFEHPAQALSKNERSGNFVGWKQYRKEFTNENGGDY